MKKKLLLLISIAVGISIFASYSTKSNDFYNKRNLYEEMPGSIYGSSTKLVSSNIEQTLRNQIENCSWTKEKTVSISNQFGGETRNIVESLANEPISIAKANMNINGTAGCGPLALYSTLEYLSCYGWFNGLQAESDGSSNLINLANKVLKSTKTYSIDDQRLASPKDILYSFNQIMASSDYNNILDATIHNNIQNNIDGEISNFMASIDKGLPIIYWCYLDNNPFLNHYLVIYAYEKWNAISNSGQSISYPVFKVRYNQNLDNIDFYIFPDMLTYCNGAIVLNYHKDMYRINDTDITKTQYYPYAQVPFLINKNNCIIDGTLLRTGYITDENSRQFLVMSPRRSEAGNSYISFHFEKKVRHLYVELALWSSNEFLNFENDPVSIEIKDENGNWIQNDTISTHLLTSNRALPDYYHFIFTISTNEVRIKAQSDATGSRNKGRIVVHNVCFIEALEENCEEKFICKFAEFKTVTNNVTTYVANCDKNFVQSLGIPLINSTDDKNYYSYIASPNGFKQITKVRRLYNNLDSLLFILSEIETKMIGFGANDRINNALAYVRTMNYHYYYKKVTFEKEGLISMDFNEWALVAGEYNSSLFQYLNSISENGCYYRDFFYSFLDSGDRNILVHGQSINSHFSLGTNKLCCLIDPLYSYYSIDLIHMFASIDGIYSLTGRSELAVSYYQLGTTTRDLASWAGDLQAVTKDINALTMINNGVSFNDAELSVELNFSREDFLADIDAYNISYFYLDADSRLSVKNSIEQYYQYNINNYYGRFDDFIISSTFYNNGFSGTTDAIFEKKVFYFLASNRENLEEDLLSDSKVYSLIRKLNDNASGDDKLLYLTLRINLAFSFINCIYQERSRV